ncbi:MAG TPA: adenylyl-sulfate kinase, partial [Gammaproteobacteria bacterium]|nr:adenylyl-sulfate kinase [Gammaproteobacteria bacterium]
RDFAGSNDASARVSLDGAARGSLDHAELAGKLRGGEPIHGDDAFSEVAAVLEAHYRPLKRSGFTLFFTGLPGSGKSAIARTVQARVAEQDPRPTTFLDGDIARKRFPRGLGFSREDHETSVRRIGAAAADITKNGGVAICCPIAPYAETRKAVRAMIEPHGPMVEIHVARPFEVCERRDAGGAYKKAREGRIQNFSAVEEAYEAPPSPDIRLDASTSTPDAAAALVLAHLVNTGLISKASD